MQLICSGWWADRTKTRRVHDDVRVIHDDGEAGPPSHGICADCREIFLTEFCPPREARDA
jgi:hypothetical protein